MSIRRMTRPVATSCAVAIVGLVAVATAAGSSSLDRPPSSGERSASAVPSADTRPEPASPITVKDGRLTVKNARGARNNKICFIEISVT